MLYKNKYQFGEKGKKWKQGDLERSYRHPGRGKHEVNSH